MYSTLITAISNPVYQGLIPSHSFLYYVIPFSNIRKFDSNKPPNMCFFLYFIFKVFVCPIFVDMNIWFQKSELHRKTYSKKCYILQPFHCISMQGFVNSQSHLFLRYPSGVSFYKNKLIHIFNFIFLIKM